MNCYGLCTEGFYRLCVCSHKQRFKFVCCARVRYVVVSGDSYWGRPPQYISLMNVVFRTGACTWIKCISTMTTSTRIWRTPRVNWTSSMTKSREHWRRLPAARNTSTTSSSITYRFWSLVSYIIPWSCSQLLWCLGMQCDCLLSWLFGVDVQCDRVCGRACLQEYRSMRDQLAETKERYREASGGVTERTRELAEVSTVIML